MMTQYSKRISIKSPSLLRPRLGAGKAFLPSHSISQSKTQGQPSFKEQRKRKNLYFLTGVTMHSSDRSYWWPSLLTVHHGYLEQSSADRSYHLQRVSVQTEAETLQILSSDHTAGKVRAGI